MKQNSDLAAKVMWQLLQKLTRVVRQTNEKLVAETITLDESLEEEDTDKEVENR